MNYKRIRDNDMIQQILDDGTLRYIPNSEDNSDWRDYLKWALTNTPLDADPLPPPDPQVVADKLDRDTFLSAVDNAIQAVNNQGWDGLPAATRKTIMLNVLRVVKVAAKRL